MATNFKIGDVVIPLVGEQKGKLGMINTNPRTSYEAEVVFWEGFICATTFSFDTGDLVFYENPLKLIYPLIAGDEIVVLPKPRLLYTSNETHNIWKKLKIKLVENFHYDYNTTVYLCDGSFGECSFVLENIDIAETNRLLILKYGLMTRNPSMPII